MSDDGVRKIINCPGRTYRGNTRKGASPSRNGNGDQTAICDGCHQRVLLNGNRLTMHYLDVTIHRAIPDNNRSAARATLKQLFPGIGSSTSTAKKT